MIRYLIQFYIILLIVDTILSYLPQWNDEKWVKKIHQVANFTLNPVRKLLPPDLPFDFSPLIVIVALKLVEFLW